MRRNRKSPEKRSEKRAANLASRLSERSSGDCELLLRGQYQPNHLNKLGQYGCGFSRFGWLVDGWLIGWSVSHMVVCPVVGWLVGWLNNQTVIGK